MTTTQKDDSGDGPRQGFRPQNAKKLSPNELKKMSPQERSRYLAYEDPSKCAAEAQLFAQRRLTESRKKGKMINPMISEEEELEQDQHAKLIGQLKAAEARNRLRIMRLKYQVNKTEEVNHLIECQPTALKAVRLQALVPTRSDKRSKHEIMDTLDCQRVEALLEDVAGLLTNRIA